ncbi:MAG: hypothetical protein RJA07_834 [Bacteroidota bacterium]|jgi:hypothetical protein
MKNQILFLLLNVFLFCFTSIHAQTFREKFDELNETPHFQGGGYSFNSNFTSQIKQYGALTMNAYLNMYEATGDTKYLNDFLLYSKRIMDRRDDFIGSTKLIHSKN